MPTTIDMIKISSIDNDNDNDNDQWQSVKYKLLNKIQHNNNIIMENNDNIVLWLNFLSTLNKNNNNNNNNNNQNNYNYNYNNNNSRYCFWYFNFIIIMIISLMINCCYGSIFQQKGCHLVGHTQKVEIPGCINFELTSNACRGYCVSYAIPSNQQILSVNNKQMITSVGNCCAMTETEVMSVRVMCRNGPKDIKFKSATKCECFHCKKY